MEDSEKKNKKYDIVGSICIYSMLFAFFGMLLLISLQTILDVNNRSVYEAVRDNTLCKINGYEDSKGIDVGKIEKGYANCCRHEYSNHIGERVCEIIEV